MNILFLTAWYPVTNTPHKGIFIQEHARAIAQAGHTVRVVVLDVSQGKRICERSEQKHTDEYGIVTHVVSIHSRFHKKLYALYPWLLRIIKKYLKTHVLPEFCPQLIHSHVLYPAGMIGAELATDLSVPHVITEHWSKANQFLETNFFATSGKRAYTTASAITCVSAFLRDRIAPYTQHTRIEVIPNVVHPADFEFAPKPPFQPVVFTAVATWMPPKRPDLFVEALNRIARTTGRELHLHLFGEGAQLDTIRAATHAKELRIFYRGFASKKEIGEQLRNTHFMLHASEIETFSIVVAEALCSGTPVIASDKGALPELVDNSNGILCDNTVESWEQGIAAALEKTYNHQAISMKYRTRFSPEIVGLSFSRLYAEINSTASR